MAALTILAASPVGCTSLLGDFDVVAGGDDGAASLPDAGGTDAPPDATMQPDHDAAPTGNDATADASSGDAGSGDAAAEADAGPLCGADQLDCAGTCVAKNDPKHCGTCGHDCTNLPHVSGAVTCQAGACVVPASSCASGWTHCSSSADDGCEVNVADPAHCGSCTTTCAAPTPLCGANGSGHQCKSSCVAPSPDLCGQSCVSKATDPLDCGQCGTKCPAPAANGQPACSGGSCKIACNAGYTACGAACVALTTDAANCGACGVACKAPANGATSCVASKCVPSCNAGWHDCGGTCALNTSVASCGARCTACPAAPAGSTQTCDGTTCGFSCNPPTTPCNGSCLNLSTDVANCGACGKACAAQTGGTASCVAGSCAPKCGVGLTLCNGQCVSAASDGANCGACGRSCGGGTCAAGTCQPVALLSGRASPNSLAADAGTLFWMESGAVQRCTEASCIASALPILCDPPMTIVGGRAYCVQGGTIKSIPVTGGTQALFFTAPTSGDTWALAQSAGNVVFQFTDSIQANNNGDVSYCAAGAVCGAPTLLFNVRGAEISSSSAGLGFAYPGTNGIFVPPAYVNYCSSLSTCSTGLTQVTSAAEIGRVNVSPTGTVYFAAGNPSDTAGQTITGCKASGCTTEPAIFATTAGPVAFIASDNLGVYWGVQNGLYGCPNYQCANAAKPIFVSSTGNVTSATFDGTSLYFTTGTAIYQLVR